MYILIRKTVNCCVGTQGFKIGGVKFLLFVNSVTIINGTKIGIIRLLRFGFSI